MLFEIFSFDSDYSEHRFCGIDVSKSTVSEDSSIFLRTFFQFFFPNCKRLYIFFIILKGNSN